MTASDSNQEEVLAINGGTPAVPNGPPPWPVADDEICQSLDRALRDGSWGQYHGPNCEALTRQLADFFQVEHVLLCCSGTYAVEAALRGLGLQAGDEVVLAGYDFPGNFRAIESIGARPVLVDIDQSNWSLDPNQLENITGEPVKAVIVSHLHGGVVDMHTVNQWASNYGVTVVEDACQEPGARLGGRMVGTFGDVSVLSFGGSKLLSAGRGGAILTNDTSIFQRAKVYGHRGNDVFPLSEMQATVLRPQLEQLDARNRKRLENANHLLNLLQGLSGIRPLSNHEIRCETSYYKMAWEFRGEALQALSREQFIATMQAEGVAIDVGFRGFAGRSLRRCRQIGSLIHSSSAANNTLLLHHPVLLESAEEIKKVAAAFAKVIRTFAPRGRD
jgi:dTDP-4-amino-4,6-dideoxygalactose transaminase